MKALFAFLPLIAFSPFVFSQNIEKHLIGYWKKEIGNVPFDAKITEYYFQLNPHHKGEMGTYQKDWGKYDVFSPDREITSWKLKKDTLVIYSYPIDGKRIFRNYTFIILKMKQKFMEVKDISNFEIMTEKEIKLLLEKPSIKYHKIIHPELYLK